MIRVAQILNHMNSGGIEAVVMNYYRNIDRTKVQFDFLVSGDSKIPQREEIESLGGKIYTLPSVKHFVKYRKELKKLLQENKYNIVHCHMGPLAFLPLGVAKACNVPVRICHNHTSSSSKEFVRHVAKNLFKPFSKKMATHYFACSELAARWMFGDKEFEAGKVYVMNNAIDVNKFEYNQAFRDEIKKELGIEDKFVVGHVGRFDTVKNHQFLIDVFAEIVKKESNAVLLLAGEGPLKEEIEQKVAELNLQEKVKFLGVRKDVNKLYCAFDALIFPSFYEGMGLVMIEAQASGLFCVVSDKVSPAVKIGDTLVFESLDSNASQWADRVLSGAKNERHSQKQALIDHGFDIKNEAAKLEKFYLER